MTDARSGSTDVRTHPSLGVVIRTFNEQRWLEPLLQSLRKQTRCGVEIIVIDSGSTDGTVQTAREYANKVLEIHADSFSYGYSLNVGFGATEAELVAIVSAHTVPMHERWIETLSSPFGADPTASGVALTYGKQRGAATSNYAELRDLKRRFPDRPRTGRNGHWYCNNANSLIRRDLWEKLHFDETLPGLEDIAWARHWVREGLAVEYVADAGVYHIHEESWPQVYNRFRREAIAAAMMQLKESSLGLFILSEAGRTIADVGEAAVSLRLDRAKESMLYRFWKTRGTLDGWRAGRGLAEGSLAPGLEVYHALEIRGQGEAGIITKPIPEVRPNEVLIRVAYLGICQTDLEVLHQTLGYYKEGRAKLPIIPGHEYSGVVSMVGANVETVKPGDRVVGECILSCGMCAHCLANRLTACSHRREVGVINYDGGCAEYVVLPARFVHRLPPGLSLLTACSVEPLAVVLKGFRRVGLGPASGIGRRRVLVIGAGAIGNLCCQAAAHWGHGVEVVDRVPERLSHLGNVCEKCHQAPPEMAPFDYIIEATGNRELGERMLKTSSAGCHLLFLGFPYGPLNWNLEQLVANDVRAIGSVGSDYETFETAIRMLPELDSAVFDQHILDLWDWKTAYDLQNAKRHLKIKLRICAADGELA